MGTPHSAESPTAAPRHLEVVKNVPTVTFHGSVRAPGMHEDINWTLEVPEEGLAYDGLVMLVPGLGCIKRHSRGERHANAVAGEATLSYNPGRISGDAAENLFHAQNLHAIVAGNVLSDAQRLFKGRPVVPNAQQINPHKVTLSVHSMGGFAGTELGLQRASEIDAVISKAAVGFGSPSWQAPWKLSLLATMAEIADYAKSEELGISMVHAWRELYYFSRSPSRTLGEIASCLTMKNIDKVISLSDKGVATGYLAFGNDGLVPFQPIERTVRKVVDQTDNETMLDYGHLAPQRYPAETAAAVRGLRKRLRAS